MKYKALDLAGTELKINDAIVVGVSGQWSFGGWLLAFNERKITSAAMTLGFVSKMIQFAIILTAAYYIDNSLNSMKTQLPVNAVTFCIGYIFYSEFLSIVENMRDSGVAHMDKLCELLTSNIFNKLKK